METGIQKYLDRSLEVLKKFNIVSGEKESQLVTILQDVVDIDEARVTAIAKTVKYMGDFNSLVRDKVSEVNVAERYNTINQMFDSIREDSKKLINQLEDGKIDLKEKAQSLWMKLVRGSPHNRFNKIKNTYLDVSKDTKGQIDSENEILNAYMDFRFALKGAEVISNELLQNQTKVLEEGKTNLTKATTELESYHGPEAEKLKLQLKRDESRRDFEKKDKDYQLFKDIAENLASSYNVGEVIVAKLKQTHDLKDQIYKKSVSFFTTNENVFTTMDATYTAQHGLHEGTQTLEAMKDGMNKGLEDLAQIGGKIEDAALKAGYGSTYKVESVQKLVDAIVDYQLNSRKLIDQYRIESTKSTQEITKIVDEGKKKVNDIVTKYMPAA